MATIYIDGKAYEANAHQNLLHQCLSLGFDLPYFCWHPSMGSVGSCRQCAVKQYKDENDTEGKLVMACMTAASDGTRISIEDAESTGFRRSVIEWLMTNHPHDCPVCEEGGECHLQDMTMMTGQVYRRHRFKKRTFRNQDLGPFIGHEMNRCITCYRCVRFYQEHAGGDDLQAMATHNHVYFGRQADGPLENEFSGNLVEVCPTGVFTDKTLGEAYSRKWDLQAAPSVCAHCGVGCNTSPGERYGELRRIVNRYNGAVNGYFICDRGRFGYGFVNAEARIREARLRQHGGDDAKPIARDEALEQAAGMLKDRRVVGIGSPRASLESNFALRTLVGAERFYSGAGGDEQRRVRLILDILQRGPARAASVSDAEHADAVLVLGEDLTNTAPRMALAVRQATRQRALEIADAQGIPRWQDGSVRIAADDSKSPLIIASPDATRLDDAATETLRAAPEDIARLGFAVAHALDDSAPAVADLSEDMQARARAISDALKRAQRPLVVSGCGAHSDAAIQAAANVAWSLSGAALALAVPESNSLGHELMAPGALDDALAAVRAREVDTVVVLENDLYRRAERGIVDETLGTARHVLALDCLPNETTARAELALPAGTFAEADGTLVSYEGRAQRFFQVLDPGGGDIQESWRWLAALMHASAHPQAPAWAGLDDVTAACVQALPELAGAQNAAPSAGFRFKGMRIPRAPHRYSGRTAMRANLSVHEPKPPADRDSALSFSMEGYHGRVGQPPSLLPFVWAPAWTSNEALNKFQDEVAGPLRGGDPGVRLIEPPTDASAQAFETVPPAFQARTNQWWVVASHHIFGSEPLSAQAPAVAARVSPARLGLHPEDAERLGVAADAQVDVALDGKTRRFTVALRPALVRGVASLPIGLPDVDFARLPAWAEIRRPSAP